MKAVFSPAWAQGRRTRLDGIGKDWRRFAVTFRFPEAYSSDQVEAAVVDGDLTEVQPLLYLPDEGTYFIAAPQLERSETATPFAPNNREIGHGACSLPGWSANDEGGARESVMLGANAGHRAVWGAPN